ncbi:hypothetical protein [Nonomuraea guangzhouensis]|uniref:DUF4245 domain-containing protein n=1 Tax=Nonomuraea guangzhouensis TaxID=1291555 RepID=A0ABW4G3I4_9ACTN|nr:hypothetical protein [Nonomuraea guangzhouensis]
MSSHDPFDDLAAELTALADFLDVPNPPPDDVAAAVRARLEPTPDTPATPQATPETAPEVPGVPGTRPPSPAPGRRDAERRPPARRRRRARWQIVTAIILAVIAITAATPQGRAAVRAILHYAGIELRLTDSTPQPVTTPTPLPGEHTVAPADLAEQVKFPIKTPTALGTPERATVSDNGRVASMFWPGGVRLDQFDGTLSPYFFKTLGPPWPEDIQVAGVTAWWLGGSHPLGYIKREDGTSVPLRQAEPTLIWQSGTTGYRLEGAGTKEHAAEIAASLR